MKSRVLLELKALREGALENGRIHGVFPKTYYAGHTGVAGLVEGSRRRHTRSFKQC